MRYERLIIQKRVKFMTFKQGAEQPVTIFLHRLKNAYRYCEFAKRERESQTIEELIKMRLIEGMYNAMHRYKMLEQL